MFNRPEAMARIAPLDCHQTVIRDHDDALIYREAST
jgi:hypothetical protein